jgi:sulfur relay (sulfurtransferase) complex TusBCD TusD component (DsrE family)
MKRQLISLVALLGIIALVAGCNTTDKAEDKSGPNTVVINLTSDATVNAHSALMGIHLAEKALNSGLQAVVFLNVNGVKLLQPGADTLAFHGENILQTLNKVVEKGGEVRICPHCAEALGIDKTKIPANYKMQEEKSMMEMLKSKPTVFTY